GDRPCHDRRLTGIRRSRGLRDLPRIPARPRSRTARLGLRTGAHRHGIRCRQSPAARDGRTGLMVRDDRHHRRDAKKSQERSLSKGDAGAMGLFIVAGVAIAGWTVWQAVLRIVELSVGRDVRVAVEFLDAPAEASLPSGALPVQLDRASVTVDSLRMMGAVPGILGQLAFALTIIAVVTCLILLS